MSEKKFHPRNLHNHGYDFAALQHVYPALTPFVSLNPFGKESINFADPEAVKTLNAALLKYHYRIDFWQLPPNCLCPPIPGRADYVHYLADLLAEENDGTIPTGKHIKGLDIGTGANLIYPILGRQIYQWQFVGSDIEKTSLRAANALIQANPSLKNAVQLRHQTQAQSIFVGVIKPGEFFDFTLCNPPFHASEQAMLAGSQRKQQNLAKNRQKKGLSSQQKTGLNFGGQHNELWCEGGELQFIRNMIDESVQFSEQCRWFTTLVSQKDHLSLLKKRLKKLNTKEIRVISMHQGQKITRILAWHF